MKRICLLDLDGCLVDFDTGWKSHYSIDLPYEKTIWDSYKDHKPENEFWEPLGRDFWADLPWTPEGEMILDLVEEVFGDDVAILSSPCNTDGCMDGKRDWIAKHIPKYKKRLFLGKQKKFMAGPNKFLVDDSDNNITEFNEYGGTGIMVPRPWNVLGHTREAWDGFSEKLRSLKNG